MEYDDTYAEAFDGMFSRILVTAKDEKRLRRAATCSTALPCTVFNESEGGIESYLPGDRTPDGRPGAVLQFWANSRDKLEYELAKRIRQGILVVPTTTIFDFFDSDQGFDMMARVGHCGDGYEWVENRFGREMINVPLMMGEFLIEKRISYAKGVMGGNVWYLCDSIDSALEVGDLAVEAVSKVEGAITSFDICSAGSKVETRFPEIGPTTNHPFCPTLKGRIPDFKVPEGVHSIPEIVINGVSLEAVKDAMRACVNVADSVSGVLKVSAGNYGGKLGRHKIWLRDII